MDFQMPADSIHPWAGLLDVGGLTSDVGGLTSDVGGYF